MVYLNSLKNWGEGIKETKMAKQIDAETQINSITS